MSLIGLNWHIGGPYGWAVFGLNLLVDLRRRRIDAIPLLEPMLADFNPLHDALLAPVWREQKRLAAEANAAAGRPVQTDRLVPHALLGDFQPIDRTPFTGRADIALIFPENAAISPNGMARAWTYQRIIAGSTWNQHMLRAHGLDTVRLARQGIDPTLFHPAPNAGLFADRFVVFSGGKLEYRKGQDIALVAFRRFHERHLAAAGQLAEPVPASRRRPCRRRPRGLPPGHDPKTGRTSADGYGATVCRRVPSSTTDW